MNGLPEVKEALAWEFDGVPLTKQNLSTWRRGEYADWLARQDGWESAQDVVEKAHATRESVGDGRLTEGLSAVLASRYAWVLANWRQLGEEGLERELKSLRSVSREVGRLCQGGHSLSRIRLKQDWKQATTCDFLAEVFYQFAQRPDIQAWRRPEWQDESKAREYLSQLLKTDLEGLKLAKSPPDPLASVRKPENN